MKQNFLSLDIRAIVNELGIKLIDSYIKNVYSNKKRYILKFNTYSMIIEPGVRMHLSEMYDKELNFFAKSLRMLRRKKLKGIRQLGFDRILEMNFIDYKVYVEFYSAGNIIVTDPLNKILVVQRTVLGICEKDQIYICNEPKFDFTMDLFTSVDFKTFLPFDDVIINDIRKSFKEEFNVEVEQFKEVLINVSKDIEEFALEDMLGELNLQVDKMEKSGCGASLSRKDVQMAMEIKFVNFFASITERMENIGGYGILIYKKDNYSVFTPWKLQEVNGKYEVFDNFNSLCDKYFVGREKSTKKKKETVVSKQNQRVTELEENIHDMRILAILLEKSTLLDKVLAVFKDVIKKNMDWKTFEACRIQRALLGHDFPNSIIKVDFLKKEAIFDLGRDSMLNTNLKEYDIDITEASSVIERAGKVNIDIQESKFFNVSKYFGKAKKLEEKLEKTKKALKMLTKKTIKKNEKIIKYEKRKVYWFEKFNFVILGGQIILSGKNAQQNETLVKKYLTNLYFHCTVQGGSSVILETLPCKLLFKKSNDKKIKPMPSDIEVAASVALCMSKCWDSKISCPVYYVNSDQVSKSAPTGECISKGGFIIRGKKNDVNVYRLEYGIALLFRFDDEDENELLFQTYIEDVVPLHCIVVSGPWSYISHFQFRAKLVFGNSKKGQLAKELSSLFLKQSNSTEKSIIKNISIEDYISVIPNNCRLGKF